MVQVRRSSGCGGHVYAKLLSRVQGSAREWKFHISGPFDRRWGFRAVLLPVEMGAGANYEYCRQDCLLKMNLHVYMESMEVYSHKNSSPVRGWVCCGGRIIDDY